MYPDAGQRLRKRADLHVLGKQELLQPLERCGGGVCGDIEQDHPARFEHMHITQHATLRRQPGGVTAGTGSKRLDVVGQEALQERRAVLAGNRNLKTGRNRAYCRAVTDGPVIVV